MTLIAAGSALAVAGIAAGTVAAWSGNSPAAPARLAAAASFTGSQNVAASSATDQVMATSVHQLKVSEVAARQTALRQAIARQQARDVVRARAARAAAAKAALAAGHDGGADPGARVRPTVVVI